MRKMVRVCHMTKWLVTEFHFKIYSGLGNDLSIPISELPVNRMS